MYGMLIQGKCSKCGKNIGKPPTPTIQFSNHYYCKKDYGNYICIDCYKKGQTTCIKCGGELSFHKPSRFEGFLH